MRDDPSEPLPTRERLVRAVRGARELSDALWDALQDDLSRGQDAARIADLCDRLAQVSSSVVLLAPSGWDARHPGAGGPGPPRRESGDPGSSSEHASPEPAEAASWIERRLPPQPAGTEPVSRPDLRVAPGVQPRRPARGAPAHSTPHEDPPSRGTPAAMHAAPIHTRAGDYTYTKLVDERAPGAVAEPTSEKIEVRDARHEEGPSAWVSSVGRLLARHSEDGLPFAVLLVEIVDVAQLERSETPHDLHGLVSQVESALGRGMRASDELSRETLGRYWLVAPETNETGARMLAERLARLVRTSATHRGVPMEVAIGIAVCPDDGVEAPALAARADLGVYSARATGRSIVHTDPPVQH